MPGMEDAPREIQRQIQTDSTTAPTPTAAAPGGRMFKNTHPMVIIAAGAVTLFCAVGIGVMTGIIPSANSKDSTPASAATSAATPSPLAPGLAQAPIGTMPVETASPAAPEAPKPVIAEKPTAPAAKPASHASKAPAASKPVSNTAKAPTPSFEATPGASAERPATPAPVVAAASPAPASAPACSNCGTVDSVSAVTEQGKGSGVGAAIGGVVGGVLGHQVGGGRGKDVATVAGAVGGALLGNQIEKSNKTTQHYDVRVRMEDGTYQTVRVTTEPGVRSGDKVRIDNGRISRAN